MHFRNNPRQPCPLLKEYKSNQFKSLRASKVELPNMIVNIDKGVVLQMETDLSFNKLHY